MSSVSSFKAAGSKFLQGRAMQKTAPPIQQWTESRSMGMLAAIKDAGQALQWFLGCCGPLLLSLCDTIAHTNADLQPLTWSRAPGPSAALPGSLALAAPPG